MLREKKFFATLSNIITVNHAEPFQRRIAFDVYYMLLCGPLIDHLIDVAYKRPQGLGNAVRFGYRYGIVIKLTAPIRLNHNI